MEGNTQCFLSWATFAVALITLVVAFFTLRSQRATERNTAPLITKDIQRKLWIDLIKQLYFNRLRAHTLQLLLNRCNYKKSPEEYTIKRICIAPEAYLHENIFYNNEEDSRFIHMLKDYITSCNVYYNSVDRKNINKDTIFKISRLINSSIALTLDLYTKIFYDESSKVPKQELSEGFFHDMKDMLDYFEGQGLEYGKLIKDGERFSPEDSNDPLLSFFCPKPNQKFKDDYYEYSNKFIEYQLYEQLITLEDDKTRTRNKKNSGDQPASTPLESKRFVGIQAPVISPQDQAKLLSSVVTQGKPARGRRPSASSFPKGMK